MKITRGQRDFKGVIFDLDGTLLDTLGEIAGAMNAALEKMGFPGHPARAYRYLSGDGVHALAERSLPESRRDEVTIETCIQEFRSEYLKRGGATTKPYPGIPELLDGLVQREVKLSVLSNKLDFFAKLAIRNFLPRWEFAPVIGAQPGLPPKPDPAGALLIARELCLDPGRIVYLGDSGVDMMTARAAGMLPLGALWGFREEKELLENGAHAVLSSPLELLAV
jgi:phosphoglycolate phosphatase